MRSRPVLAWALYDFANTIFSFAVVSFYFNDWIVSRRDNPDWYVGAMNLIVSVLLIAALPALGAVADRRRLRVQFLAAFTIGCVLATAAIATTSTTLAALIVCGVAIFCYQCALAQYDPLLADIAPPERQGRVSGFGVGLGYLGALFGAVVLLVIVGDADERRAFVPTAVMYAVFALPALLWVRERRRPVRRGSLRAAAREASSQLLTTARHIRNDHRETLRFLLARFLYADALVTVIAVMAIYMDRVGDFPRDTKTAVQALSLVSAAVGGVVAGRLVEVRGPKWVLIRILLLAIVTLVGAAIFAVPESVWVLGPLVGIALGGVWASDRVFMMRLSPPAVRGEFFSIYSLVGRMSSGVGPFVLWGGTLYLLHERMAWQELAASRAALGTLALATIGGLLLLRGVDDAPRDWREDQLEREVEAIGA